MQRRLFLSSLAALPFVAGMAHAAGFTAIDITGSSIGPDYQLLYSDGKPPHCATSKARW
jgi:protein SCO1/2